MIFFITILVLLLCWRCIAPIDKLYDFDSKATLPLRGILAIFIMFHHISLNYDFSFGIQFFKHYPYFSFNLFNDMGVPIVGIFFFLTGYGLAKSLSIKGKSYLNSFLKKRLSNILPEFLFLTILISLYFIASDLRTPNEIITRILHGNPPLPASWFMYAIVYVYISFNISSVLANAQIRKTGIIFTLFIIAYILYVHSIHWGSWWYVSIIATPLGFFIASFEKSVNNFILNRHFLFGLTIFSIIILLMGKFLSPNAFTYIVRYGIIILTYICMRLYNLPKWSILLWLGEISLNIYLIHSIFIMIFKGYQLNPFIVLCLVIILSVLSAFGIKEIRQVIKTNQS